MFDRAGYALSDFLLFSARVYARMFELHNATLWPLHLLALAIGGYVLWVVLRPSVWGFRLVLLLLGLVWAFIAWAFFIERYATINWAAIYIAPAFVLQALLLFLMSAYAHSLAISHRRTSSSILAFAALLIAIAGYPLIVVIQGRSWMAAELFGIAPDPTVVATLAVLSMARGVIVAIAVIIPLLWILATTLTLYALGSAQFVIAPFGVMVCLIAHLLGRRQNSDAH